MKSNVSHKTYLHLLIIALFGFLVYSNTFHAHFELDDDVYIIQNAAIKDFSYFLEPSKVMDLTDIGINFRYAFITRIVGYFTFALNYYLHGLDVTGYHVFNLIIHIINGLLVYVLVRLIFQTPFFEDVMPEHDSFSLLTPGVFALCSALIFVSHPVQTEAVTYISQRFASLSTLFYLLSIVTYMRTRLSGTVSVKYSLYAISLISAVMAMLVKEISFTLPVMIALFEIFFFRGTSRKRALLLFPFALTMLVIPAAILTAQGSLSIGNLNETMKAMASEPALSRPEYLFTQFRVIVTYLRLLFLPVNQNLDYDYPFYHTFFTPKVFLSFLLLLLIFLSGVYCLYRSIRKETEKRHYLRLISLGIFWFFITISVESSIIPIQDVIFEHRLYLPSVGFIIAIMASVAMMVRRAGSRTAARGAVAGIVCAACVLGGAAYARNSVWKTNISLWQDVVKKSPSKARPHYNLGVAYTAQGRTEDAVKEFRAAIQAKPDYFEAHYNLAKAYTREGRIADAIKEFLAVIQINPDHVDAHYNLGIAYSKEGDIENAIREYRIATAIDPAYFKARNNLANAYLSLGRTKDAIREYMRAIQIDSGHALVHYNLGLAYAEEDRPADAIREFLAAIQLAPGFYQAHYDLGVSYRMQGRTEEAVKEFQTTLDLYPNHTDAKKQLEDITGMIE
jgi:tetratricopeptide (TPR) repeat protein